MGPETETEGEKGECNKWGEKNRRKIHIGPSVRLSQRSPFQNCGSLGTSNSEVQNPGKDWAEHINN